MFTVRTPAVESFDPINLHLRVEPRRRHAYKHLGPYDRFHADTTRATRFPSSAANADLTPMTLTFQPLGGALEVGANCFVLSDGHRSVMLDAGLHPKKEGREALPDFAAIQGPQPLSLILTLWNSVATS